MRRFYSHLNIFGLPMIFLFFLCPLNLVLAEDIDIDMSGSVPVTSSASSGKSDSAIKQNSSTESSKSKSELKSGESSVKAVSVNSRAVVNQVLATTDENGTQVSINGENLPRPKVENIKNKKIVIKFSNTKLEIPKKIESNDSVVKTIRSSVHAGRTAWVVLDVTSAKKWSVEASRTGYLLNLNFSEKEKPSPTSVGVNFSQVSGLTTEKSLFSRLVDVSLKPIDKGIKIVLTSDGASRYTVHKLSQPEKLVVLFQDTKLEIPEKSKIFKANAIESQKGGLLLMEFHQIGPSFSPISEARLTLVPGTTHQIDRDMNQVVITLFPPRAQEKPTERKGNLNQLVSLDIEAADLSAVIKTLAVEAGFDVDFVNPLTGIVNQKFKDIPLKTALAILLAPGNFDFEVQGNTLRVGVQATLVASKAIMPHVTEIISPAGGMALDQFNTLVHAVLDPANAVKVTSDTTRNVLILNGTPADIADYKRAIKDLKLDEGNSDHITRIVKLNYANPINIQTILEPYLTPVGKVQIKENSLVIWEQASNMGVLLELIKELDKKPAQVLIESNIVEIDSEKDLNVGIDWSANKATGDPIVSSAFNNPPVNAQGSPGSFSFGTIRSGLNINATLQALETHKKGKIISRPRIATASGVPAEINTTENIVIATTTTTIGLGGAVQTTTTFTNLPLPIDLKVTPRITDDGRITTVVNASITSQTGPAQGAGAPPPTSVQTATTTITTKNGETIVIGGLVRETATDIINGIPLLSSLPIVGTLFQEHEKSNQKVELVIFITPTLLED